MTTPTHREINRPRVQPKKVDSSYSRNMVCYIELSTRVRIYTVKNKNKKETRERGRGRERGTIHKKQPKGREHISIISCTRPNEHHTFSKLKRTVAPCEAMSNSKAPQDKKWLTYPCLPIPTSCSQQSSRGTQIDGNHRVLVTLKRTLHRGRSSVPELNRAIFGTGNDPLPVVRNGNRENIVLQPLDQLTLALT